MGNLYSIDSERSLFLYPYHQFVYLRNLSGEQIGKPTVLCSDYSADLSSTIHKNTLYFAYQNTRGDLLVRSILDPVSFFRISAFEANDCSHPVLFSLGEELLLVYIIKNPLNLEYSLKCVFPFNEEKVGTVPESFSEIPEFSAQTDPAGMLLWIRDHSRKLLFFISPDLSLTPLEPAAPLKERIRKLQSEAEAQTAQNAALEHTIREISEQYEQLMDTARQYRDEAKKWYDSYRRISSLKGETG